MQRASRVVLGIFWGSIIGVLAVVFIVLSKGKDGGYDAIGWAWIDVYVECLLFITVCRG